MAKIADIFLILGIFSSFKRKNNEISNYLTGLFLPESILVTVENENQITNLAHLPFFTGKKFDNQKTTVFVCKDFTCSMPLESILEIEKHL